MGLRDEVRAKLTDVLRGREDCLAAWEGGSEAFGRSDELSDVDICVVVEDGASDAVYAALREASSSIRPISLEWEVPQPTFHGARQWFFQFEGEPNVLVDFCLMDRSKPWKLSEIERHAEPIVLFDRGEFVPRSHVNPDQINSEIRAKLNRMIPMTELFHPLVDKAIQRGLPIDAVHFYQRMILFPLVDCLRMRYAPDRHDYAARYLRDDLPVEAYARLQPLYFVADLEDLAAKKAEGLAWLRVLLKELDATIPS